MDRVSWMKIGKHLRKLVGGKGVHCKVCDKIMRFDPVSKAELRHSCQLPDESVEHTPHDARGWDDDDAADEDCGVGSRIGAGFEIQGYGDDLREYTRFERLG